MAVLGSGSGGNATLLHCDNSYILIDAGLSARQLVHRLAILGIEPEQLDGILLTHEHSDHARGIDVLMRKHKIPVFANAMTREALQHKMTSQVSWKVFQSGQDFSHGAFKIKSFRIPHDAAEPVGFVIQGQGIQLGILSDVGHINQSIRDHLAGLDGLYIEANYDDELLEKDTKRPWAIKQRIQSQHGHLSNDQTAEILQEIACEKLKLVMLSHLSSDCNCPIIASETVKRSLNDCGLHDVSIHCAEQHVPSRWHEIANTNLGASNEKIILDPRKYQQDDFFLLP